MIVNIFTDGGARGNPGPAGFGLVVYDASKNTIHQDSVFIGTKTNNEAEYSALLNAIEWVKNNHSSHQITKINFHSDSQLLVRQMQGLYKVKAQNLRPFHQKCLDLLTEMDLPYSFIDIRRELNCHADELANNAMDRGI